MATAAPNNQQNPHGATVAVSAVFQPDANLTPDAPDVVFSSTDRVFFYVHQNVILAASNNGFAGLLTRIDRSNFSPQLPALVSVGDDSPVLNVILHTIYGRPVANFNPSVATLEAAVHGLVKYGVDVQQYIAWTQPLCNVLFAKAPDAALNVFTIAAQYGLEQLAVASSTFLLSVRITDIPVEYAERMGPIYLRRLLALQDGRLEVLRTILRDPPRRHPVSPGCSEERQDDVARAWELAAAYLIWERRPEITHITINVTFSSLLPNMQCPQCVNCMQARIAEAANAWAAQRRHI